MLSGFLYNFFGPRLKYHSKMAIAPNGNIITTCDDELAENVYILDYLGKCIGIFWTKNKIQAIAILPNGKIIITTPFPHPKLLLFTDKGELIYESKQQFDADSIAVLPNGNFIVADRSNLEKSRIINSENGELIKILTGLSPMKITPGVRRITGTGVKTITVLKDGRILTVGPSFNNSPQLRIFNAEGRLSKTHKLPSQVGVDAIAALSNEQVVIGGFSLNAFSEGRYFGKIAVFDPNKGKLIKLVNPQIYVESLMILKGDRVLVCGLRELRIINLFNGKTTRTRSNNEEQVIRISKAEHGDESDLQEESSCCDIF